MNKPVYVVGSGGHAAVLIDELRRQSREIAALVAPSMPTRQILQKLKVILSDEEFFGSCLAPFDLVNGVGSLPGRNSRHDVYQFYNARGLCFSTVIAQSAVVSPFAKLGEGVQIMPGAIVQAGASVGEHTIINTGAVVEHDCVIGSHNHISPRATLCGHVTTGDFVHIGAGATLIQNVVVGSRAVVGAGAVACKDVNEGAILYPARSIIK